MIQMIPSVQMIIAYVAWPPDNGTYMWADTNKTGVPPPGILCDACGQRIDYQTINPNYRPPRSYYDLSRTYDGDFLVSPRLREHWEQRPVSGITFVDIPSSRRYFVLRCTMVLKLARPESLRFEEYCSFCRQYRSVWGLKSEKLEGIDVPIEHGVFTSDLRVGYYPQFGPELIIGVRTWEEMIGLKVKGLANGQPITER
jgi:hypothetical protein